MGALLAGVCDPAGVVRQSCLGCLADAAATLGFALQPWAVELLQAVSAALEGETDAPARIAACYLLGLLLQSLGADALHVLSAKQLAALYRRLQILRQSAVRNDLKLLGHIDAALEQMRSLGRSLVRGSLDGSASTPLEEGLEPEGVIRNLNKLVIQMP